ncbi:hypothetical protein D0809_12735 [Flavobacterium circumlabens]|uniref:DUF6265 domain-containing protein n=1 Tax=Flavobacterium circumlabens TaxID=2133765 RepID=A0A4Y7UCM9_9FLAO|nr:DUF6265 family protein [Flavobacterium circumlabens]TCN57439.1 hypothetical protein EV142_10496 [Flavobacterium circumlabens]TEB43758.1 hypothetical protein D0809_12735 [Flavobacterium circumlabens]
MFQKITLLMLLAVVVSCQKKESVEKDKIKIADWLIGNWENKSPDGLLIENWQKVNDSTFSATSYFIKEKDTLHFEKIVLSQKGEKLTYSATVNGQNNDKAIDFPSTSETETKLVFENPQHDYPQKITYTKGANNTLTAEVTGKLQGKLTTERFIMVKK